MRQSQRQSCEYLTMINLRLLNKTQNVKNGVFTSCGGGGGEGGGRGGGRGGGGEERRTPVRNK